MATVQKWGNSLAVRIPTALAGQLNVTEGSSVELEVRDAELVMRPAGRPVLSLKQLLKGCTASRLHGETDFGADMGREVIE